MTDRTDQPGRSDASGEVVASDYDFGVCVCGRAIVKHKSREGYWHINGALHLDHKAALRAALPHEAGEGS